MICSGTNILLAFTLETPRGLPFHLIPQSRSMPNFVTFTHEQTHIRYIIPETSCVLINLYYVCLYVYTYQLTDRLCSHQLIGISLSVTPGKSNFLNL